MNAVLSKAARRLAHLKTLAEYDRSAYAALMEDRSAVVDNRSLSGLFIHRVHDSFSVESLVDRPGVIYIFSPDLSTGAVFDVECVFEAAELAILLTSKRHNLYEQTEVVNTLMTFAPLPFELFSSQCARRDLADNLAGRVDALAAELWPTRPAG